MHKTQALGTLVQTGVWHLSPVAIPLEVEPKLEDPIGELTTKPVTVRVLPFPVHDLKSNVLVRWARMEP